MTIKKVVRAMLLRYRGRSYCWLLCLKKKKRERWFVINDSAMNKVGSPKKLELRVNAFHERERESLSLCFKFKSEVEETDFGVSFQGRMQDQNSYFIFI